MNPPNADYTIKGFSIYGESRKETAVNILLLSVPHIVKRDVDIAHYLFSSKEDISKAFAILETNSIEVEI